MNIKTALKAIQLELEALNGAESAAIDARYLLSFLFNKNFTWLKTWPDEMLSSKQQESLHKLITRRKNGEPIAYITGEKAFWTLRLKTNTSTLIPRPETEQLVEQALDFLATQFSDSQTSRVLDLGTGTGAIALAIATERPNDAIIASDFNEVIVELAKENAKLNQCSNVSVLQSDWFSNIKEDNFNLIVSNPPYIEENDRHIQQGDLVFEPNSALVAKNQGLSDIKIIIEQAKGYLMSGGALMIEHGFEQGKTLRKLYNQFGYHQVKTIKDLNGLDRITLGIK